MLVVLCFWFPKLLCHINLLVIFSDLKSRCTGQVLSRLQGSSAACILANFSTNIFLLLSSFLIKNGIFKKVKCNAAAFPRCSNEWRKDCARYFEIASLKIYFMLCPHLLHPITYRIAFVFWGLYFWRNDLLPAKYYIILMHSIISTPAWGAFFG